MVRSFVEKLEVKPGTYLFAVVTMGHAAKVFNIVRHFVMNLLFRDSSSKCGISSKRKLYALSFIYLEKYIRISQTIAVIPIRISYSIVSFLDIVQETFHLQFPFALCIQNMIYSIFSWLE